MNLKSIREQQNDLEFNDCEENPTEWMEEFSKIKEDMCKRFEEKTIRSGYKFNGMGHYVNDHRSPRRGI